MTLLGVHSGSGCACVTIGAAAGTILAAWAFLMLGPAAGLQRSAGQRLPESRLRGYDAWDLEDFLRRAGAGARDPYRRELLWGLGFAVVYGIGLTLVLAGTWGRVLGPGHSVLEWVVIVPAVAAAAADLIENVLLLQIANPGTEGPALRQPDLVGAASWTSRIKWVLVALTLLAIAGGAVTLAFSGTNRL